MDCQQNLAQLFLHNGVFELHKKQYSTTTKLPCTKSSVNVAIKYKFTEVINFNHHECLCKIFMVMIDIIVSFIQPKKILL